MSKLTPRLVWCPDCHLWTEAPPDDDNVCARCGAVSTTCKCTRCGFEWTPRGSVSEGHPKQCYKCNSPYFDRKRIKTK